MPPVTRPITEHDAYRRQARRLRHAHRGDVEALQRALGALARGSGKAVLSSVRSRGVRGASPSGAAEMFAVFVLGELDGSVLRYTQRQALVEEGVRRGIGRFEANLIIAAAQHRAGERVPAAAPAPEPAPRGVPAPLLFCVIQGAIVAGGWLLLA